MKKKRAGLCLLALTALLLTGCGPRKAAFTGVVLEAGEDGCLLVAIDPAHQEEMDRQYIYVPVNDGPAITLPASRPGGRIQPEDHISVTYNGNVWAQACGVVDEVYTIAVSGTEAPDL